MKVKQLLDGVKNKELELNKICKQNNVVHVRDVYLCEVVSKNKTCPLSIIRN